MHQRGGHTLANKYTSDTCKAAGGACVFDRAPAGTVMSCWPSDAKAAPTHLNCPWIRPFSGEKAGVRAGGLRRLSAHFGPPSGFFHRSGGNNEASKAESVPALLPPSLRPREAEDVLLWFGSGWKKKRPQDKRRIEQRREKLRSSRDDGPTLLCFRLRLPGSSRFLCKRRRGSFFSFFKINFL